jgi:hypothetical protein
MNFLGIKKQHQKTSVSDFGITLHSDFSDHEFENNDPNHILEEQIDNFENATLEVTRLSKLDETLNEILGEKHNEDIEMDNENNESESNNGNESENLSSEFIKSTEIRYILENNNPTNIELPDNGNEPEELIFRGDDTIDVYQILSIRRSHEAYSNSDRVRGINQKPGVNLEINSNDQINRNTANHLITQLNSNDFGNQIIEMVARKKKDRKYL